MLFSVNCDRGRFIPRCHALGVRGKGVWKGPVVVVWIDAVRRIIISIANVASKVAHLRINLATTEPHGRSQGASSELRESRRQRRGLFAGLQTRLNAERAPERPQQQRSCARESEPRHGACGFSNAVVHRTRPFVHLAVSRSRLYHFRPLPRFALRFLSNRSGLPFARCCLPVVAKETSITFTCTTPQDKGRAPRQARAEWISEPRPCECDGQERGPTAAASGECNSETSSILVQEECFPKLSHCGLPCCSWSVCLALAHAFTCHMLQH
jgi:hypothetical protein